MGQDVFSEAPRINAGVEDAVNMPKDSGLVPRGQRLHDIVENRLRGVAKECLSVLESEAALGRSGHQLVE